MPSANYHHSRGTPPRPQSKSPCKSSWSYRAWQLDLEQQIARAIQLPVFEHACDDPRPHFKCPLCDKVLINIDTCKDHLKFSCEKVYRHSYHSLSRDQPTQSHDLRCTYEQALRLLDIFGGVSHAPRLRGRGESYIPSFSRTHVTTHPPEMIPTQEERDSRHTAQLCYIVYHRRDEPPIQEGRDSFEVGTSELAILGEGMVITDHVTYTVDLPASLFPATFVTSRDCRSLVGMAEPPLEDYIMLGEFPAPCPEGGQEN